MGTVSRRDKLHGYLVELDLSDWSERLSYFLGRYYDLPSQLALRHLLRDGDVALDVGANIGMMTLLMSRCVGPRGRVVAFEPNPSCVARMRSALEVNAIRNVDIREFGLANVAGSCALTVVGAHTGTGSLADLAAFSDGREPIRRLETRVEIGDEQAIPGEERLSLIKIDVEGFEEKVLVGLRRTLERRRPMVISEMLETNLARAGSSRTRVFALMTGLGYSAFGLTARRRGVSHVLALDPIRSETDLRSCEAEDWLWVDPESRFRERTE